MPFNPQQVGAKLVTVGDKQIDTGKKMQTYSSKVKSVGIVLRDDQSINESIDSIETGTRSIRNLLAPVAGALHTVSNLFDAITIPTIDFTRTTFDIPVIGRQRFVTAIALGSTRPFRTIASNIENVADDIDAIRTTLQTIANGMNTIQGQLPAIADNLITGAEDMRKAGQDMIDGGTAMKDAGNLLATP